MKKRLYPCTGRSFTNSTQEQRQLLRPLNNQWYQYHFLKLSKIVSEYDQEIPHHKPLTIPWHLEEEPPKHHETPERQIKQSNQLSLPHQDDCNIRTDTKQHSTKHRTITDSHNGNNNKQKVNNNRIYHYCLQQYLFVSD